MKIKSETEFTFSVIKVQPTVINNQGEKKNPEEINFLLLEGDEEIHKDKQPITISLSKEEALKLATFLKEIAK